MKVERVEAADVVACQGAPPAGKMEAAQWAAGQTEVAPWVTAPTARVEAAMGAEAAELADTWAAKEVREAAVEAAWGLPEARLGTTAMEVTCRSSIYSAASRKHMENARQDT